VLRHIGCIAETLLVCPESPGTLLVDPLSRWKWPRFIPLLTFAFERQRLLDPNARVEQCRNETVQAPFSRRSGLPTHEGANLSGAERRYELLLGL